jgi:hypothetical protein
MVWTLLILFIAFFFIGAVIVATTEHKAFNKGYCKCGEKFESFDTDSQGGTGWQCPNCGFSFWTSWVQQFIPRIFF